MPRHERQPPQWQQPAQQRPGRGIAHQAKQQGVGPKQQRTAPDSQPGEHPTVRGRRDQRRQRDQRKYPVFGPHREHQRRRSARPRDTSAPQGEHRQQQEQVNKEGRRRIHGADHGLADVPARQTQERGCAQRQATASGKQLQAQQSDNTHGEPAQDRGVQTRSNQVSLAVAERLGDARVRVGFGGRFVPAQSRQRQGLHTGQR